MAAHCKDPARVDYTVHAVASPLGEPSVEPAEPAGDDTAEVRAADDRAGAMNASPLGEAKCYDAGRGALSGRG